MNSSYFAEPVRAKDVQITTLYQAACKRGDCIWAGGVFAWRQAADDERAHHLAQHREGTVDDSLKA